MSARDPGAPGVLSDKTLARRAAAGDRDAWGALVERHGDAIYRYAARELWSSGAARVLDDVDKVVEDATQEVWISLPKKLASWRGEGKLTTWLYPIVINTAKDMVKKADKEGKARRKKYEDEQTLAGGSTQPGTQGGKVLAEDEPEDAEEAVAKYWKKLRLLKKVGVISEKELKTVRVLSEGMTHKKAGERLEAPEGTVSWRMHVLPRRVQGFMEAVKSEEQWDTAFLVILDGMTHEEASKALGVSEQTAPERMREFYEVVRRFQRGRR